MMMDPALEPDDGPLTDEQRAELDRRSADLDRDIALGRPLGRPLGIPWEEVLRQIRERPRRA
jgi:hypothetical protein